MTRLELCRRLRGLTQQQLGAVSGTAYPDISRAERGMPLYPGARRKLAQALGVDEADLFDTAGTAKLVEDPDLVLNVVFGRRSA